MALLDGLLAYWKLDEASSTDHAQDAHSNDLDLAQVNTPNQSGAVLGANSRWFDAAFFQQLKSTASNFNFGDTNYSFACWVWTNNQSAEHGILGKDNGSSRQYRLDLDTNLNVRWFVFDNGQAVTGQVFPATLTQSTWYHIVCWYDATNSQLGCAVNAGTPSLASCGTPGTSNPDFTVGSGNTFFQGAIDEVGVWTRVLTSQERIELYNGGSGRAYSTFGGTTINKGAHFYRHVAGFGE